MTGIPPRATTGSDLTVAARTDRTTLAISKALQEQKRETEAMLRLIEGADVSDKGQVVNYKA